MIGRALTAAAAVLIVGAWLLTRGGGEDRTLRATFANAIQIVPGQEVRIAGRKIGSVGSVKELDGEAVAELHIDKSAWPLHRGTTTRLRYGTLSGYAGRFVDLRPGPPNAPALPTDGVLGTDVTVSAVEFDQIFNTYDAPTRRNLRGTLDGAAATVGSRAPQLQRGLRLGAPGMERFADLMGDLGSNPGALRTLLRSAARTAAALHRREADLRELLPHAAGTFDELASRARDEQATLERLPGTLRAGTATLTRLEGSLDGLRALVADLAPGARALDDVAPLVRSTVATLHETAPLAASTLETGRRNVPAIARFLKAATRELPRLGSVLRQTAPALECIRPYAPEIGGTLTTWGGLASKDADGGSGRANLTQMPPLTGAGTKANSVEITTVYRNRVFYAMPRPPGLDSGKPWFLPECGAGRDALDPTKDPERR